MPFCPNCKMEYVSGVEICSDCGLELVEQLPEEIGEEGQCDYCGNPIDMADEYCKFCGTLLKKGVNCYEHPQNEAIALCLVCKKPLCADCISEKEGKAFCKSHNDYKFTENMAVVGITDQEWEAELNKKYLEDNGVPTIIFSHKDGVLAIGKQARLDIMVPFEYVLEAERLLEEFDR